MPNMGRSRIAPPITGSSRSVTSWPPTGRQSDTFWTDLVYVTVAQTREKEKAVISRTNVEAHKTGVTHQKPTEVLDASKNGCAILRQHNRFVCCGDPSGNIELRDPGSLRVEHSWDTHTGSLSDFDIHGNLLVTCGFSNRSGLLTF
ncbi:poly(A)-specific ribonuclease [Homalodisca vitripennis]|nr:poly(A)-specific ribonuclease [Homalodisca vitripennis]